MRWSTTPCRKFSRKPEIIRAAAPPDSPKYKEDLTNGPTQSCTPPGGPAGKTKHLLRRSRHPGRGYHGGQTHRHVLQDPADQHHRGAGQRRLRKRLQHLRRAAHHLHRGPARGRVQAGQRGQRHRTAKPGAPGIPAVPGAVSYPGCAVLPHHVLWLGTAGCPDERRPGRPRHSRPGSGGHLRGLSVRLPGLCPGPREHDAHRRLPDHRGPV